MGVPKNCSAEPPDVDQSQFERSSLLVLSNLNLKGPYIFIIRKFVTYLMIPDDGGSQKLLCRASWCCPISIWKVEPPGVVQSQLERSIYNHNLNGLTKDGVNNIIKKIVTYLMIPDDGGFQNCSSELPGGV